MNEVSSTWALQMLRYLSGLTKHIKMSVLANRVAMTAGRLHARMKFNCIYRYLSIILGDNST